MVPPRLTLALRPQPGQMSLAEDLAMVRVLGPVLQLLPLLLPERECLIAGAKFLMTHLQVEDGGFK